MGSGFTTFTAGNVLTASEMNNYLMEQSVMVFATTAARDSAITAPEDGMICYVTGDDAHYVYETVSASSAWRRLMPPNPHTSASGLLTPTGARSITSTSYVDFPGTDLLKIDNFVKHRADSQLLVSINGNTFSPDIANQAMFGLRVNSIDYDVGWVAITTLNAWNNFGLQNLINVPTAGTYTLQARMKVDTGTRTSNTSSKFSLVVTEIRP